jgi:hypothetical protein
MPRPDPGPTLSTNSGYFDQAHFIRECHTFAGLPPSGLVGDWDNIISLRMTKIYKRFR